MNSRQREEEKNCLYSGVLKEQFAQILKFGHYLLTGGDEIMTEF